MTCSRLISLGVWEPDEDVPAVQTVPMSCAIRPHSKDFWNWFSSKGQCQFSSLSLIFMGISSLPDLLLELQSHPPSWRSGYFELALRRVVPFRRLSSWWSCLLCPTFIRLWFHLSSEDHSPSPGDLTFGTQLILMDSKHVQHGISVEGLVT